MRVVGVASARSAVAASEPRADQAGTRLNSLWARLPPGVRDEG